MSGGGGGAGIGIGIVAVETGSFVGGGGGGTVGIAGTGTGKYSVVLDSARLSTPPALNTGIFIPTARTAPITPAL